MDDPFTNRPPELGFGLDEDATEVVTAEEDCPADHVCGPGDGDATVMSWARAM